MQKIETNESFTVDYQITEEDRKTIPDEFLEYYKYLKELKAIKEFEQKIISVIDKQIVPVMKPQLNKYGEGYTATQIGTLLNKHCSVIGRTVNKLGLRDSLQKIAFVSTLRAKKLEDISACRSTRFFQPKKNLLKICF